MSYLVKKFDDICHSIKTIDGMEESILKIELVEEYIREYIYANYLFHISKIKKPAIIFPRNIIFQAFNNYGLGVELVLKYKEFVRKYESKYTLYKAIIFHLTGGQRLSPWSPFYTELAKILPKHILQDFTENEF